MLPFNWSLFEPQHLLKQRLFEVVVIRGMYFSGLVPGVEPIVSSQHSCIGPPGLWTLDVTP